jgi:Holliday junction resolvase RusA-like endonuclease
VRIVALRVDGVPRGKQRPAFDSRKAGKRGFTRAQTRSYEDEVQAAWQAAGRVDLGDGPLGGVITAVHRRPRDHYTAAGALSAKGRRFPLPVCKPDADNVLKIVLDALHCPANMGRLAFTDDTQIVQVRFERRWATDGEVEHTAVRLWRIGTVDDPGVLARADADEAVALAAAITAAHGMPADAARLAELVRTLHNARLDGAPDPYAAANAGQAAALLDAVSEHATSSIADLGDGLLRVTDTSRAFGRSLTVAPDGAVIVDFPAMT